MQMICIVPCLLLHSLTFQMTPRNIKCIDHERQGLCIKPVTEPDQTEPTEITELTRPNLRELPNVPDRTYGKCRYIDTGI